MLKYTSYLQSSLCLALSSLNTFPLDIITKFGLMQKGPIIHPIIPINNSNIIKFVIGLMCFNFFKLINVPLILSKSATKNKSCISKALKKYIDLL